MRRVIVIRSVVTRILALMLGLAMVVQLIRPLGIPGLHRRADAWKIAALALAIMTAVAALKPN